MNLCIVVCTQCICVTLPLVACSLLLTVKKPAVQKIVHFIPKTGCKIAAAFHLIIFYHKFPRISIA